MTPEDAADPPPPQPPVDLEPDLDPSPNPNAPPGPIAAASRSMRDPGSSISRSFSGEAAAEPPPVELPARSFAPPPEPGVPAVDRSVDLIAQIKEYVDKLHADKPSRGDLKLIARTIRELRYAFKIFAPYRRDRKVTLFGSARLKPDHPGYVQAAEFGKAMAERRWFVVTGAAHGIMEAGHVGAGREWSMGINIMLPFEQSPNPVIAGDPKLVNMKYFFTRKLMFVKECDAVCLCPGGFGTLDEGLEVLTLLQTGKRDMCPVVFLEPEGSRLWVDFDRYVRDRLLAGGLISKEDLELYKRTHSVEEAVEEITGFYSVYHSQRYVRDKLVFRLQRPLSATLLEGLNHAFADILREGRFEQSAPLAAEADEPELAHFPRLVFSFNRRDLGRLRRMINCINCGSTGPEDVRGAASY